MQTLRAVSTSLLFSSVVAVTFAASAHADPVAVGSPAPDFTLKDIEGKTVKLADYANKRVVLEWFNPSCPFVKAAHSKGSLVDTAQRHIKSGTVWLAINSGAAGKQGAALEDNRAAQKSFAMGHQILLDTDGKVGHAYGATNTPHMMVIDHGKLVYRGAIDNSPDGEKGAPSGGQLINYVDAALAALAAGKPVATPETKAYGCSVKY